MKIGSASWKRLIMDGAGQLGVAVSDAQAERFAGHARLLYQWNRRFNLTAISDPVDVAVKHYIDAISVLPEIGSPKTLLDVGTGGGFPGIPIKIMLPKLQLTLIDAVRKKTSFVQHCIRTLSLDKTQAHHLRVEEMARRNDMHRMFDVIACRAFSRLDKFVRLAEPMLAPDGHLIALKSDPEAVHAGNGLAGWDVHIRQFNLPVLGDQRCIVTFSRF